MMRISLPGRPIVVAGLVSPRHPALARAAREQLEERAAAARFDDLVLLVRLARMLALARRQEVHLPPSRRERARAPAAHPEQDELGHVPEIETHAASVRPAVLAHLVPDDVGFVDEAPRLHHREA